MSAAIIVSYDGTPNDDDALSLGRLLAPAAGGLGLAYVRHSREFDAERERVAQHDAERRLAQGAALLGDESVPRHVIFSPSTGDGLAALATREQAAVIVFGSDYRVSPGRVEPGGTAQHLLEGGPVAIAVAAAGVRARPDVTLGRIAWLGDGVAEQTARALAQRLGGSVTESPEGEFDLLVASSRAGASPGRIALSGAARNQLNSARSSVLVLAAERPLFG